MKMAVVVYWDYKPFHLPHWSGFICPPWSNISHYILYNLIYISSIILILIISPITWTTKNKFNPWNKPMVCFFKHASVFPHSTTMWTMVSKVSLQRLWGVPELWKKKPDISAGGHLRDRILPRKITFLRWKVILWTLPIPSGELT